MAHLRSVPNPPESELSIQRSIELYISETAPSPIEKRSLARWFLLALIAIAFHGLALHFSPHFFRPIPPPPVEITQVDPAKLAAIKNKWKERGFLVAKDPSKPKDDQAAPKDARYESDRNRSVEKETRGKVSDVIPNTSGKPDAKTRQEKAQKENNRVKNIPLASLSNFQGLPVPGRRPEEAEASERQGRAGPTADQNINEPNLPEGAEAMLNTVESVYYTFYARIYDQIGPLWQSNVREAISRKRYAEGSYLTQVDVVFDSEGNYQQTQILTSSGVPEFDHAVVAAWAKIPRFPNPPRSLIQPDGKIHMGWSFHVLLDSRMQWQYMPPERQY